jgi:xanthine/CO dehydrogenase XdhC/CoxF family maturation factor
LQTMVPVAGLLAEAAATLGEEDRAVLVTLATVPGSSPRWVLAGSCW